MSKHEFQTQVGDLLNLMIHSLYSNKEIFLRELISNASDALDKLNFLTLTNDEYKSLNFTPKIEISVDKDAKILRISDNGIGMNKDELIANLGTIARSGTKGFLENLSGDTKKDSNLIGQFGVGFYSAFMVANRVEVCSKKALQNEAFLWSSDAKDFSVNGCEKADFGTEISLFLNDDEFLSEYRLENIIKKYSNHIPYSIYLKKEVFDENKDAKADETTKKEQENGDKSYKFEQINRASAIWQMQKSALKQDDYNEFYKQISHDSNDPLLYIHTKAEGAIEYSTLFFI
ncbi:MAG: ATP-binding protein, partial [Campylobacter sp.]